jgi:hypothetical protein
MNVKHLPPTFTWQEYLDWCEETAPDATYEECRGLFELFCAKGLVQTWGINEDGHFIYELKPKPTVRIVVADLAAYIGRDK